MAKTHVVIGLTFAVYKLGALQTGQYTVPEYGAVLVGLVIGSLLPDIDHPQSTISQFIPIVGRFIAAWTQHRGLFHSILGVILLFLTLAFGSGAMVNISASYGLGTQLPRYFSVGIIIGYVLHIIADMITTNGVKLLYPLKWNVGLPLFSTGGIREMVLRWGLIGLSVAMVVRFILGYIA